MRASDEVARLLEQARGSVEETWPGVLERFGPVPEEMDEQLILLMRKMPVIEDAVRLLAARVDASSASW